jgi:hypothetical protein
MCPIDMAQVIDNECVLAVLPGRHDKERIQVVLLSGRTNGLALRQQTYGDGLGWFTQKSLDMAPHQLAALKTALGAQGNARPAVAPRSEDEFPRILRLESA